MTRQRRTPAENAELAMLFEVAGTPKPGNVDRTRDLSDLRFEQFLAGAVGSARGLRLAGEWRDDGTAPSLGEAFEEAVAGMGQQSGDNTQFGCLLLLVPLVRAAARDDLSASGVDAVCRASSVDDAVAFYRSFEHVDVAVGEPPEDAAALDVRRGSLAEPALRAHELTLRDVLAIGADRTDAVPDTNACEWVEGFPRTFDGAERLLDDDGPVLDRTARLFLHYLAAEPDTLVATKHGDGVAEDVRNRAEIVRDEVRASGTFEAADSFADELVSEGVNPGTTADRTAAALFVALERGLTI